jgi:ubiquitin C-terminal hydrolase
MCNQSIIVDLFHGETKNNFRFSCGTSQDIVEPLASWALPLPPGRSSPNLEDCIQLWEQEQYMTGENGLWCDDCNCIEDVRKEVSIVRSPPILIIQLKRFTDDFGKLRKNSTPVRYSLQLNLLDRTYDLTGVVCHFGTLSSGHYTCLVRDSPTSSQWYHISDSNVEPVSGGWEFQRSYTDAMTLFYQSR